MTHSLWRISLAVLLITGSMMPVASPAQTTTLTAKARTAQAEVAALVQKVADAYAVNDLNAYFSYFDEDVMIWNGPNARWVKQDYVTRWTKVVGEGGGVSSLTVNDLQLRASPAGDSVVATFALAVIARKEGKPAATEPTVIYHMTETWFKRGGRWSMSHMHWSARTPPKP